MAYVTIANIRNLTSITADMVSDDDLAAIIIYGSRQLNEDIQIYERKERIKQFSDIKLNTIDGSNTTYYVKNGFIGDLNDDFEVTASDVEVWGEKEGVRTDFTVSSVDASEDQYTLSAALANDGSIYYHKYKFARQRMDTPAPIVQVAALQIVAAWAMSKLNVGKATRFHLGNMTVFRDTNAYEHYMRRYDETIAKINSLWMFGTIQSDEPLLSDWETSVLTKAAQESRPNR